MSAATGAVAMSMNVAPFVQHIASAQRWHHTVQVRTHDEVRYIFILNCFNINQSWKWKSEIGFWLSQT